jgi:hypothetical protein
MYTLVIIAAVLIGAIGVGLAVYAAKADTRPADQPWPAGWVLTVGAWCAIALSVVVGPLDRRPSPDPQREELDR